MMFLFDIHVTLLYLIKMINEKLLIVENKFLFSWLLLQKDFQIFECLLQAKWSFPFWGARGLGKNIDSVADSGPGYSPSSWNTT